MKKYFMQGIDEPVEFGDSIGFEIVVENEGDTDSHKHIEVEFIPEIAPLLEAIGVIEEKEETIDFTDDTPEETTVEECLDKLADFADKAGDEIENLHEKVNKLEKAVKLLTETQEIAANTQDSIMKIISSNDYKKRYKEVHHPKNYIKFEDYIKDNDFLKPQDNWTYDPDVFQVYCSIL